MSVTPYPNYPGDQGGKPLIEPHKSKTTAALLFFFLGIFGAGNFYLNQYARGACKVFLLLLALPLGWMFVGQLILFVSSTWVLVEFIFVLVGVEGYDKDSRGIPLK